MKKLGAIKRGCGYRKAGAIYTVSGVQPTPEQEQSMPDPLDLDSMLLCPPWRPWVDSPAEIGISAQGLRLIERVENGERKGVWDIWDWVGENNYPYFPYFWEEGCLYGFSRLAPITTPFKLLSLDSLHFFIHSKAIINEPAPLYETRLDLKECPTHIEFHQKPDLAHGVYDHCTALLWESVGICKPGQRKTGIFIPHGQTDYPTGHFHGAPVEENIKISWRSAVLAYLPVTKFEVVEDDVDGKHTDALKILEESGTNVPYVLVNDEIEEPEENDE
jgi:hypothetical protein